MKILTNVLFYFVLVSCFVGLGIAQNFSLHEGTSGGGISSPNGLVVINYDGDNAGNSVGDGGTTFQAAARFTPAIMGTLTGGELQYVQFHYTQEATGLTIIVYDAGTATDPGSVLLNQPLNLASLTVGDWNEITLSSPVTITGNDLWIAIEVQDATAANFPLGVDAGPADPNGDFVNDSGTWQHLNDFGLNYNWNIRGVVEDSPGGGGTVIFSDNFDSYISGEQLACQNPTDWTTWSNLPCDATEDAYISSNYAHSGANSFVVVPNNDEVHAWGPVTSGKWEIDLYNYLPTGATGYFNQLGQFTAVQEWGLEVYFNAGGAASINAGGTGSGAFTFVYDTWVLNQVIVDLDNDQAEYWYNGSMVFGPWQWTAGSNGTPIALSLEANDFFGAAATDEMYVDDYKVIDLSGITPVELTSFAANVNNNGQVVLNWATASETNNQMFEIQRTTENSEFVTIGFVNGAGTTTEQQQYSYTDRTVDPGTYSYRLKQIDFDGRFDYSNVVDVDVKGPLTFELKQNYPNPFNPTTNIKYNIPVASNVKLAVYNVVGEEVAVLVNGFVQEGFYEVTFNASSLPSGVYFYKLQSGNLVQTNKMMLLK